jgi:hypothetical protein
LTHHWARENSDETSSSYGIGLDDGPAFGLVGLASNRSRLIGLETTRDHPPRRLGRHLSSRSSTFSARLHVVPVVQCDGDLRLRFSTTRPGMDPVPRRLLSGLAWTGCGGDPEEPLATPSSFLWRAAHRPATPSPTPIRRPFACPTRYRRLADPGPSRKKKKSRGAWEHPGSMALDHNTLHRRICASRARTST